MLLHLIQSAKRIGYVLVFYKQLLSDVQVPDECSMLTDSLIQFLCPGHKIGTVSVHVFVCGQPVWLYMQ